MRALSVREPWASLIASGEKTLEIRSGRTHYRGPLLICATQPSGNALCVADVIDCRPMTPLDCDAARVSFRPGHFAWVLANVRPIKPFAVRGRRGIFEVIPPSDAPVDAVAHEFQNAPPLPVAISRNS